MQKEKRLQIRAGCKDTWNAFMTDKALFTENDIPLCPTTARVIPQNLISYPQARALYNKHKKNSNLEFSSEAYVHFYVDDQNFDGKRNSIWLEPFKAIEILQHFGGIITPDFSTYSDFPYPIQIYNTYRMRTFGYWYGTLLGYPVINNVRWETEETFSYCFDGIPKNSIVAIGTVASGLRKLQRREIFSKGLFKMVEVLSPRAIIVYGSDRYFFFDELRDKIQIIRFKSDREISFEGGKNE